MKIQALGNIHIQIYEEKRKNLYIKTKGLISEFMSYIELRVYVFRINLRNKTIKKGVDNIFHEDSQRKHRNTKQIEEIENDLDNDL